MAETDNGNATPEKSEEKPKSKKGFLILILVLNILIVGGGMAAFWFLGNKGAPPTEKPADTEKQEEGDAAKPDVVDVGPMVELSPFLVNLDEPGANRYLKAVIQLEIDNEKDVAEVKTRDVQLRHLIITFLSSLNYSNTQGVVNKEIIRTSLMKEINKHLSKAQVKNLYFTEFVIQ